MGLASLVLQYVSGELYSDQVSFLLIFTCHGLLLTLDDWVSACWLKIMTNVLSVSAAAILA